MWTVRRVSNSAAHRPNSSNVCHSGISEWPQWDLRNLRIWHGLLFRCADSPRQSDDSNRGTIWDRWGLARSLCSRQAPREIQDTDSDRCTIDPQLNSTASDIRNSIFHGWSTFVWVPNCATIRPAIVPSRTVYSAAANWVFSRRFCCVFWWWSSGSNSSDRQGTLRERCVASCIYANAPLLSERWEICNWSV